MNLLYVVPDLDKVSGGPRTRISMFRKVCEEQGEGVIMTPGKWTKTLRVKKVDQVYAESATNRVSLTDIFCLLYLRFRCKTMTVFIRDIYAELFPEEYRSIRGRVTLIANRLSYFFLSMIATRLVFPTQKMGTLFYEKNRHFAKRPYFALPPGCMPMSIDKELPDFLEKPGLLYLGSVSYANAGFEHFLNFADNYKEDYTFYVLSGDSNARKMIEGRTHVFLDKIAHGEIPTFIQNNNIMVAIHTRPRNAYDDITFPIKALDFVSFQLPFLTEEHLPLKSLLGDGYPLFVTISDYEEVHRKIKMLGNSEAYEQVIDSLEEIGQDNSYEARYKQLL